MIANSVVKVVRYRDTGESLVVGGVCVARPAGHLAGTSELSVPLVTRQAGSTGHGIIAVHTDIGGVHQGDMRRFSALFLRCGLHEGLIAYLARSSQLAVQ